MYDKQCTLFYTFLGEHIGVEYLLAQSGEKLEATADMVEAIQLGATDEDDSENKDEGECPPHGTISNSRDVNLKTFHDSSPLKDAKVY